MLELPAVSDAAEVEAQINERAQSKEFSAEYKEKRKLAKRIVRAVQPALVDATQNESELLRRPFEQELRQLDLLLEQSFATQNEAPNGQRILEISETEAAAQQLVDDHHAHQSQVNGNIEINNHVDDTANALGISNGIADTDIDLGTAGESHPQAATPHQSPFQEVDAGPLMTTGIGSHDLILNGVSHDQASHEGPSTIQINEPITPSTRGGGEAQPLSAGGIPWYMETFDPEGTTVQEERWTGRELVRGMSEELSDIEDEALSGLMDVEVTNGAQSANDGTLRPDAAAVAAARRKAAAKRRRNRGYG